jgi:hypothetical protein
MLYQFPFRLAFLNLSPDNPDANILSQLEYDSVWKPVIKYINKDPSDKENLHKLYSPPWEDISLLQKLSQRSSIIFCYWESFREKNIYIIQYYTKWQQVNITVFKGTVARDFRPLVFFINQSHLGPWLTGWNRFAYGFVFAEKIDIIRVSAVSMTPRKQLWGSV